MTARAVRQGDTVPIERYPELMRSTWTHTQFRDALCAAAKAREVRGTHAWVLEFSGYPPSPNVRLHYMERARRAKHWRRLAEMMARIEGIPKLQRAKVSAVIVRRVLGRADEDNDRARLKPICDGLVDAGVIPDDRRGCIEWGDVLEERGTAGLRLIIEALR